MSSRRPEPVRKRGYSFVGKAGRGRARVRATGVLVRGVVLALVLVAASLGSAQRASELLARARLLAAQAEALNEAPALDGPVWAEALALGEAALELAPDDPAVLRFLAEGYGRVGWWIRAWDAWRAYRLAGGEMSAEARSRLSEAGRRLAYARYAAGDPAQAAAYYRAVLDLNPDDQDSYLWLGRIYQHEQPELAAAYFAAAAAFEGNEREAAGASPAFARALALYQAGETYEARLAFVKATEADPEDAEAWAWLGRTRFEQGSYALAAEAYREALRLEPSNPAYREALARIP